MSRFLTPKYANLAPYVPGEQPRGGKYIKLNTNESPFPPSPRVAGAINYAVIDGLKLYSDPAARKVRRAIADYYGLNETEVVATNGSDEALTLAYFALCGGGGDIVSPDISYGFYPVLAGLLDLPGETIPLKEDFTVDVDAFCKTNKHIVLANPNAPTGIALPLCEMGKIIAANLNRVVIVDEAYVDFGGESCIPLIKKYDNLIVVQTFSKSRSLAGARLGFAAGQASLMADLDRVRDAMNPYNINSLTELAGIAAVEDKDYFEACRIKVVENREVMAKSLAALGFQIMPSSTNFIFARHPGISGKRIYEMLKAEGVLVRRFDRPRIEDYLRISVGSRSDIETLIKKLAEIVG